MIDIDAYIITVADDDQAIEAAYRCMDSIEETGSTIDAQIFDATTPKDMYKYDFKDWVEPGKMNWNWPVEGNPKLDITSGLHKFPYAAADWKKVYACSISHFRLWEEAILADKPIARQDVLAGKRYFSPVNLPNELYETDYRRDTKRL